VNESPAGFWRRYAAWSLDWLLLGAVLALPLAPRLARAWQQLLALDQLVQDWVYARIVAGDGAFPSPVAMAFDLLADPALADATRAGSAQLSATLAQVLALVFGASTLYFVASEASPWHATPGKRLARLRVVRADGEAIGIGRALARHLAGALSWLVLNLGHAIAGWRADRRALHDLIAGTRVLAQAPMPAWARAWLWLQLLLLVGLLLGLFGWLGWQLLQIARM
jgi:uncharacterized RDD family membrane protein YckC